VEKSPDCRVFTPRRRQLHEDKQYAVEVDSGHPDIYDEYASNLNGKVILMLIRRFILFALIAGLALPAAAQVALTGAVSEWRGGTPTATPKQHPLPGVTVVAGTDLNFQTGQSGTDEIRGKVAAKTITDERGRYTLILPAGRYTIVYWKAGYTPQVDTGVVAPKNHDATINTDKSMHGLHRSLSYASR
jgi:hypothetical protein